MQTIPIWLQTAFADWLTGRIYLDGGGNYRSRLPSRSIVAYNRQLKWLYTDNRDFHRAADRWLSLWETVPTARLRPSERTKAEADR
jgi:hypothetical protein